ncbi:MAG: hypothetical protein CMH83_18560 [Nocardioides sp.]|nr:hypothetical protein [Nocardioides sp.]
MAKKHKLAGARIDARTQLDVAEAVELIKSVAADTRVTGFKYNKKVRIHLTDEAAGELSFCVMHKYPILEFSAMVQPGPPTRVSTTVDSYATSQETLMLIPIAPKQLEGYPWYRQFMANLGAALSGRDPESTIEIIEREAAR